MWRERWTLSVARTKGLLHRGFVTQKYGASDRESRRVVKILHARRARRTEDWAQWQVLEVPFKIHILPRSWSWAGLELIGACGLFPVAQELHAVLTQNETQPTGLPQPVRHVRSWGLISKGLPRSRPLAVQWRMRPCEIVRGRA